MNNSDGINFIASKTKDNSQKKKLMSLSGFASSTISTVAIENLMDQLKRKWVRESTQKNYCTVWRLFNKFIVQLDRKPNNWEERLVLFVGYLINDN